LTEAPESKFHDLVLRRYAMRKGISLEEAREKFGPLLAAATGETEKEEERIIPEELVEDLRAIAQVSDKLPDESQRYIQMLASGKIERALLDEKGPKEKSWLDDLAQKIREMKVTDKLLSEAFPEPEKQPPPAPAESPRLAELEARLDKLTELIQATAAEKEAAKLESILAPIREEIADVKNRLGTREAPKEAESITALRERLTLVETTAKAALREMGYDIPEKPEKEAPKTLEQLKAELEAAGYKVEDMKITRVEAEKMVEEARQKAQEEMLDDHRIKAVENIVSKAVDNVIGMFRGPLERYFEGELERRARAAAEPTAPLPPELPPAPEVPPPPTPPIDAGKRSKSKARTEKT